MAKLAIAPALLAACAVALADDSGAILSQDFEKHDGGWIGIGNSAKVTVTHDAATVKSGQGALQLAYTIKKGEINAMILPTDGGALAKAKSIRFWFMADHTGPFSFALQKKNGSRYNSLFSVVANQWQQVEINPVDMVIETNGDAPKDSDGKLDLASVSGAGIVDLSQLFLQGDIPFVTALGVTAGERKLYIDDFQALAAEIPSISTLKGGLGVIDSFARPQITWMAVGRTEVSRYAGKPLEGVGMQAKYHQSPTTVSGFNRYVAPGSLAGAGRLMFSAASLAPTKFLVQVEEKGGGKYNTVVELPGGSARRDISVSFADFKPGQDSKDANGKLDLDQVTNLIFLDISGFIDQANADNMIWINRIKTSN